MKGIFKLYIFKLVILSLTMIFISFGANSSHHAWFSCVKLKANIEASIENYFANLQDPSLRRYRDHKDRAKNYLDIAHKQSNVYNAICKDKE